MCFVVCKTTSELEHVILTTLYFASVENTNSWHARKGDLQRAFPLGVPMVHSSVLAISTNGECLTCGGFSLGKTVAFGSLDFITDCFGGLSLSPRWGDSGTSIMGTPCSRPPTPLWAMIEDSTKELFTTSSGEGGGSGLPPSRRHNTGALCSPVVTTPWLENAPAT
jgi:hypothetical protein